MLNFKGYAQGCTQSGLQFLKPKIIHQQKIEARQYLFLFEKTPLFWRFAAPLVALSPLMI